MSGLQDIVEQMATQISTALAVTESNVQVKPIYVWNPTPPTVDIYPGDPSRGLESAGFSDDGEYLLTVRIRIGTADYDAGYGFLLATMDDDDDICLPLILLDDPTLGGYAMSIDIRDATGLRAYDDLPFSDGAYLGWQFTCLVIPARS